MGPQESAPRKLEPLQQPNFTRREYPCLPPLQLDRARHLALHFARRDSYRAAILRERPAHDRPRRQPDPGRAILRSEPSRSRAVGSLPPAFARLRPCPRRHPVRRRHYSEDHRRARRLPLLRARQPRHRSRSGWIHGAQETGGLLLMASLNLTRAGGAAALAESPESLQSDETFAIEEFLASEETKDLLRFSTAGSVDDGKSTLIGRLLYDSRNVYEDQIRAVTGTVAAPGQKQLPIDVTYRYFSTQRRKFIIADTPGHEQYTRNMATGASTANLAIILIDARK